MWDIERNSGAPNGTCCMSDEATRKNVTVAIMARNEEKMIKEVVEGCIPHCDEVLVMDGHSTDKTREWAVEAGARVELDGGLGKGEGIRRTGSVAEGDIIVFIDCDGSHDPDDIPKLTGPIQDDSADMVVASRPRGGSDEMTGDLPKFIRTIGSHIITLAINYRFNIRLTESQNGFRAIRKDVLNNLGLTENIFTIEQEMILKALKKGYRIHEVPSHEYERRYGTSQINVWKVWHRYVWCVLKNIF